jgi:hypothetical protein
MSSYEINDYKYLFMDIVFCKRPKLVIELGILHGYSLLAIATALKQLGSGKVYAYDLFEDYQYNHGSLSGVKKSIVSNGFENYVDIYKADAYKVHQSYKNNSVDIIHIDISNNGDVLNYMIDHWTDKLTDNGIIIFEGGSEERDTVDWMIKYNKKPIRSEIHSNKIITEKYFYVTHTLFPSLTIFYKQRR